MDIFPLKGGAMVYIKSRSGRFLSQDHIIGFAIEDQLADIQGKRVQVFEIIAYLPEPLLPAIIGNFYNEEQAERALEDFMARLARTEKGTIEVESAV